MTMRQILGECFALFCTIMLGLAAGALWLLPAVLFQRPLLWLALPIGWLLAVAIRHWVHAGRWNAALLAAIATAVACVYLHALMAATDVAFMMGYGLIDAIRASGVSMLLDLARISLHGAALAWAIIGVLLAAFTAWRRVR